VRINAVCRAEGLSYSRFICGLKRANIALDRKQLSELAIRNELGFKEIVTKVKEALA
jgi:large subunit ribosomal protein L20